MAWDQWHEGLSAWSRAAGGQRSAPRSFLNAVGAEALSRSCLCVSCKRFLGRGSACDSVLLLPPGAATLSDDEASGRRGGAGTSLMLRFGIRLESLFNIQLNAARGTN